MTAKLDHMIVTARDKTESARFLAGILGLAAPTSLGKFVAVALDHGLSLDFCDVDGEISGQHYAFAVSESDFDAVLGRVRERGLAYWADPQRTRRGEVARRDRGRAIYFEDPSGHWLEVLTTGA
jgi:catechol 2,3-dioxygenase-like lactoylglutathione lyase family enzyme